METMFPKRAYSAPYMRKPTSLSSLRSFSVYPFARVEAPGRPAGQRRDFLSIVPLHSTRYLTSYVGHKAQRYRVAATNVFR